MLGGAPGEERPAPHDDIDISGVELETAADAVGHFGRDQTRPRAKKRVINHLSGPAVVVDRTAHALDRLLGTVPPALLALTVAERIVVDDLPDRRLRAVAAPMTALALAHGVPAGFVLPVIIAAAQREVLLGPDDLSTKLQPASSQTGGDDVAVQGPMPDIGHVPREQRIGHPPAGAIVVQHRALRKLAPAELAARSPGRLVADPIRRIGDHQVRR